MRLLCCLNLKYLPLSRKIKLFSNYVLGPLLFVFITYSIYRQVKSQPEFADHWQAIKEGATGPALWWLGAAMMLMPANWGIEALKWQKLLNHIGSVKYSTSLRSVMTGVAFTMLTPNRLGEFLGRVLYLPDGSRIRSATLTMLSSLSQLIITFVAGLIGLVAMAWQVGAPALQQAGFSSLLMYGLGYGTAICIVAALLFYFEIGWLIRLLEKVPPISKYAFFIHQIGEIGHLELLKILGLSVLRYLVFLAQYLLLFHFFQVDINFVTAIWGTAVMFLMLAIIPTVSLAELGIRGQVSLFVFSLFTANKLGIVATAAGMWGINIILPAAAGSLLLLRVKLFSKTDNAA
jgi:hypothetical protein